MYYFYVYADCDGKVTEFDMACAENSILVALIRFASVYYGKLVLDVRKHPITDQNLLASMQKELAETRKRREAKGWKNY